MTAYYFTESIKYLLRARLATLIAILATSLALMFLSFSLMLLFMSNTFETKIKENIRVNILLNNDISTAKLNSLKNKIKNDKHVRSIKYVSAKSAKQNFIRETGEDFSKLLKNNPLPASLVVKFYPTKINNNSLHLFVNDFRFANGVEDVIYDFNILSKILKLNKPIKLIIFVIALLLNIFAVYFVYTINRHFIISRKTQYDTMKLVGAKLISIKMPLLIASMVIGIISSLIVISLFDFLIILINKYYDKFIFTKMIYLFNLTVLIFGIFISSLSSYFAGRSISMKIKQS